LAKWQLGKLREWDLQTNSRVDQFIANSKTTQARIKKFYNRGSIVIEPPVQDRFYKEPLGQKREGYVAFGRMVPYKRFDLLVKAANLYGFKLTLAGTGSEEAKLKAMAGDSVTFLGRIDDSEVAGLYARHKALLYPQFEDAGIVPKEAQATGTPVIGFGKGGLLETVTDSETGVLFNEQTVISLWQAIQTFETMEFDEQVIRDLAERFNVDSFREKVLAVVEES
jgi:glycosyltransferase involved in cell wall biosynthesis